MNTSPIRPLSTSGSYASLLLRKLRLPIVLFILLFGSEAIFNKHLAVRTAWAGSSTELRDSMNYCTLRSFPLLHRYEVYGYEPFITFVEPKVTLREWCIEKIKAQLR